MLFWVQSIVSTIDAHRPILPMMRKPASQRSKRKPGDGARHGFRLPARPQDRMLLSIGYLVAEGKLDESCYDLLASEARLASFFAIAKGDIPARHWFRLGRSVTPVAHAAALVSWSGSMFEYLMPSLVMRAPAGSLIEQTSRLIVRRQIDYGAALGLPWGISESAYNARDLEFTYQYSNFGIPGPGAEARTVRKPRGRPLCGGPCGHGRSCRSHSQSEADRSEGGSGSHGYYEALDYTPSRVPESAKVAVVKAFMAHHQGMTIVAIADTLFNGRMRARFHAEPIIQATELLAAGAHAAGCLGREALGSGSQDGCRVPGHGTCRRPPLLLRGQAAPPTLLLSNGRYTTMLTTAASGYSSWGRHRPHALARGCDLRRSRLLHLSARREQRCCLVGRLPAERHRAR
jgi:cyclic beta-1,2-glucan synthetase